MQPLKSLSQPASMELSSQSDVKSTSMRYLRVFRFEIFDSSDSTLSVLALCGESACARTYSQKWAKSSSSSRVSTLGNDNSLTPSVNRDKGLSVTPVTLEDFNEQSSSTTHNTDHTQNQLVRLDCIVLRDRADMRDHEFPRYGCSNVALVSPGFTAYSRVLTSRGYKKALHTYLWFRSQPLNRSHPPDSASPHR